ncbi:ABC transporter substrate-binding protein [Leifsonia sp. McL0607]|uniref:ABC transporter substrate-binding protein n=1 Tax=Leifsonia sp. McL0607 TaxID=3415672 RepID=UPI003CF0F8A6
MKRNHRIVVAAVSAVAALALSACSTSAQTDTSKANLTFMTFETPALTASFWDSSIKAAQKEVPNVSVKKIVSPDADRNAYAKQLQASGQFPDVLSSINPKDFTSAGLLKPFDESWLKDNFLQPDANAIGGKTYIPPTNSQVLPLVFYNKALFEKAGVKVPTNYAEFTDAVAKLKASGVTPIELAGSDTWAASMPLVALASADVLGSDPDWIQKRYAGKVTFADPEFVAAMQKQVDLIKQGAYDPAALSTDFATANKNFLAGKAAMYIMGSWFTGSSYMTADQAKQYGAFPFPTDSGKVVIPFNMGGTTSVSAKSANVGDAAKFAQAWSLAPENLKVLIETDGAYPNMKNVKLSDFGASVSDLYTATYKYVTDDNEKVAAFGWVNNDNALAPGINDDFYALSQALFSNSDVQSQLQKLDSEWDAATKK